MSLPINDRITVKFDNGVADVRLNRPDKRNALDSELFTALVETANELSKDPTLRCVVLSGEGASFCAGLDFSSFQGMADNSSDLDAGSNADSDSSDSDQNGDNGPGLTETEAGRITHFAQQACYGWTTLPVPVIAALKGHALGGGIQLALACDIRISEPKTKMSVLEIRWGLIPDMTGTQSLISLVGLDVAKELTFTGRMVETEEALRLGLVTEIAEDARARALEMAHEIAAKSPHAVRAAKRLFNDARHLSAAEGFAAERDEIGKLIGSPNQVEAISSFFEKRPANYSNPS